MYALLVEGRSQEDRERFDSELYAPPGMDENSLLRMGLG